MEEAITPAYRSLTEIVAMDSEQRSVLNTVLLQQLVKHCEVAFKQRQSILEGLTAVQPWLHIPEGIIIPIGSRGEYEIFIEALGSNGEFRENMVSSHVH